MNPNLSLFLNLSRWLAAFLVVISHLRQILFVDYQYVEQKTFFVRALYQLTGLGHVGVVVFFVVSGYLVGGITLDRWRINGPNLRTFAISRVSRIYTVLIPALIIGFSLDLIGLHWFNSSELYTTSQKYNIDSLRFTVSAALDLPTFVGNLFMMQKILTEPLGSNGPLWSLAYEWWYYCIFALVGAALTVTGKMRIVFAVAAAAIAILLPTKIIIAGILWVLGVASHSWVKSCVLRPPPALSFGCFLLLCLAYRSNYGAVAGTVQDILIALAYVLAMVSVSRITWQVPFPHLHEWLAEFSYTTYLFHFPVMLFIVAVGYQIFSFQFPVQPIGYGLLSLLGFTVVVYIYCLAFSLLTERHTNFVRNKLDSLAWRPLLKA